MRLRVLKMDIIFLSFIIFLTPAVSAEFQVLSQEKLVAEMGSDVLLPCTLSPPLNRTGLEVRWFFNLFYTVVFLMTDGLEDRQQQNTEYRERTSLQAGPETGDLTLSLRKVRMSDSGKYHCFVENKNSKFYEEAFIELKVIGLGSPPFIKVSLKDSYIQLSCSSSHWFPAPKMRWEREGGVFVQTESETSQNQSDGLFTVDSTVLLDEASEGNLYCGVRHNVTGQETGAYIKVSEALYPRVSPWAIAFALLLVISLSLFAVTCWMYHKFKRDKEIQLSDMNKRLALHQQEIEPVLFDPLTNFHGLLISPDLRVISTTSVVQNLEFNPERFDTEPCCLATPAFSTNTHYWETEIQERDGMFWSLGIAKKSVRRTGGQRESPESGIWAIRATPDYLYGLSEPPVIINPSQRPHIVGTFLDYENGTVSFYDAQSFERLFQFDIEFLEAVYPFYYVGTGMTFVLNPERPAYV
ncbi:butyrophilin subfamily 1 member A1-like isoform 2-T2 [Discoglossus pictus]